MTGVIYVVIIALWAAVLIPLWLRRHDQISEVRSTARFHSAMRSLSTSRAQSNHDPKARGAGAMDDFRYEDYDERMREVDRDLARQQAASRRATVLAVLSLILLVSLVLAFLSVIPKWVPALTALPVAAFILATAMTASARSDSRQVTRADSGRAVRAERDLTQVEESARTAAAEDDWENWNAWDDDDSWDAVPTTLPTYVSAPRASQVPRRIDRSRPGEWTGAAMVETAQAMLNATEVDHSAQTAELPVVQAPRVVNQ